MNLKSSKKEGFNNAVTALSNCGLMFVCNKNVFTRVGIKSCDLSADSWVDWVTLGQIGWKLGGRGRGREEIAKIAGIGDWKLTRPAALNPSLAPVTH